MSMYSALGVAYLIVVPFDRQPPNPDDVKTGWLGFAVFAALAVAVVLLWLSFRKQLKKINFVEEPREADRSSDRRTTPS
jgi:hypothetical protein